jgi:hypothetical protein
MSRVNSQGLLGFNQAAPSVEIAAPAPQFIESRSVGGQLQVAQPRQQVGPSSEEAAYAALAQIAGGVAKGLDNFADIGSRIEKEKIQRAQLIFDEIDADETMDPDTKFSKLEERTKDIYTPLLGDNWKKEINNRVKKQWMSQQARDSYEERRYKTELGEFLESRNLDINSQLTPELLDEFQNIYENRYPLSNTVSWFQLNKAETKAKVAVNTAKRMNSSVMANVMSMMSTPPENIVAEYNNTLDANRKKEIENEYPFFFESVASIPVNATPQDVFSLLRSRVQNNLEPSLMELPDDVKAIVLENVEDAVLQQMPRYVGVLKENKLNAVKAEAGVAIDNAFTVFNGSAKGDVHQFLDAISQNLGPLWQDRDKITSGLVPLVFDKLSKENPESSPYEIWNMVEQQFSSFENLDKLMNRGMQTKDWLSSQKQGLMQSNTWQNRIKVMVEDAKDDLGLLANNDARFLFTDEAISGKIKSIFTSLADALGIPKDNQTEFVNYMESSIIAQDSQGNAVFAIDDSSMGDWFRQMPPEFKTILNENGFTLDSNRNLRNEMYAMMTSAANIMIETQKNTGKTTVSETTTTPKVMKPSEASVEFFTLNPGEQDVLKRYDSVEGNLKLEERYRMLQIKGQWNVHGAGFTTWLSQQAGSKQLVDLPVDNPWIQGLDAFMDQGSNPKPDLAEKFLDHAPRSVKSYIQDSSLLDPTTGELTANGAAGLLVLEYKTATMSRDGWNTPQVSAFMGEFRDLLSATKQRLNKGETPTRELYIINAVLQGLRKAGRDKTEVITALGSGGDQLSSIGVLLAVADTPFIQFNSDDPNLKKATERFTEVMKPAIDFVGTGNLGSRDIPLVGNRDTKEVAYGSIGRSLMNLSLPGPTDWRKKENWPTITRSHGFKDEKDMYDFIGSIVPGLPSWDMASTLNVKVKDEQGLETNIEWEDMGPHQKVMFALEELRKTDGSLEQKGNFFAMLLKMNDDGNTTFNDPILRSNLAKTLILPSNFNVPQLKHVGFAEVSKEKKGLFTKTRDMTIRRVPEVTVSNGLFSLDDVHRRVRNTSLGFNAADPTEKTLDPLGWGLNSELEVAAHMMLGDTDFTTQEATAIVNAMYKATGSGFVASTSLFQNRTKDTTLYQVLEKIPQFRSLVEQARKKYPEGRYLSISTQRNGNNEIHPVLVIGDTSIPLVSDDPAVNTNSFFRRQNTNEKNDKQSIDERLKKLQANIWYQTGKIIRPTIIQEKQRMEPKIGMGLRF